jgi:FkbM family methyltransferase
MQFGKFKLDRCRYGWMLHAGPYIGKCFELYGQYSESEIDVFRVVLRQADTCIDVGANIGDLTLPMSQLVGPSGRVYAVESHLETFQVLNANLALNGVGNVKALNCFVADREDTDMGSLWGEHAFVSPTWKPPVMRLDDLKLESCRLIKVDVDGKEYEVLRSGERTITAHKPVLYFENDDKTLSPRLLNYVAELGYVTYFHAAPVFAPDNFFGNPVNHWAPRNIVSLMMLALPREMADGLEMKLPQVTDPSDWWPF